jgi:hypothetical protein
MRRYLGASVPLVIGLALVASACSGDDTVVTSAGPGASVSTPSPSPTGAASDSAASVTVAATASTSAPTASTAAPSVEAAGPSPVAPETSVAAPPLAAPPTPAAAPAGFPGDDDGARPRSPADPAPEPVETDAGPPEASPSPTGEGAPTVPAPAPVAPAPSATPPTAPPGSTPIVPAPGNAPSDKARMVCDEDEVRAAVEYYTGETMPAPPAATFANGLYTCPYALPSGTVTLSVMELADMPSTVGYFEALKARLGSVGKVFLGEDGFATPAGSVVVRKDELVLLVDTTAFADRPSPRSRGEIATNIAVVIMECWV